jgi:hypothetical protein
MLRVITMCRYASLMLGLLVAIGCGAAGGRRLAGLDYQSSSGLVLEPVQPGKTVVVFLEEVGLTWQSIAIFDGTSFVTLLGLETYYVYVTDPGPHSFKSRIARGWQHLEADLAPGRLYVAAVVNRTSGPGIGRIELQPVLPEGNCEEQLRELFEDSLRVHPNQVALDWYETHERQLRMEIAENSRGPRHTLTQSAAFPCP